jgi:hypothetical protein
MSGRLRQAEEDEDHDDPSGTAEKIEEFPLPRAMGDYTLNRFINLGGFGRYVHQFSRYNAISRQHSRMCLRSVRFRSVVASDRSVVQNFNVVQLLITFSHDLTLSVMAEFFTRRITLLWHRRAMWH